MLRNSKTAYGSVTKGLHWVLFVALAIAIIAGNFLAAIPNGPGKLETAGILLSQSAGIPVGFFGLWELPTLLSKDLPMAKLFRSVHGTVWIVLVVAVVGHVGAALHHHFTKKDDLLKRMTMHI